MNKSYNSQMKLYTRLYQFLIIIFIANTASAEKYIIGFGHV